MIIFYKLVRNTYIHLFIFCIYVSKKRPLRILKCITVYFKHNLNTQCTRISYICDILHLQYPIFTIKNFTLEGNITSSNYF